jgi:hypothetical protein
VDETALSVLDPLLVVSLVSKDVEVEQRDLLLS